MSNFLGSVHNAHRNADLDTGYHFLIFGQKII